MANEAGTRPVIVLTKADTVDNASVYADEAKGLQRDLPSSSSMRARLKPSPP